MEVIDYIKKCVDKHIEMTPNGNRDLVVNVDYNKQRRYGFVQIGGVIYIPNSEGAISNGCLVRSSDEVDGWEEFNEIGIQIPFVKKINIRRLEKVGLFFYVNEALLVDLVDIGYAQLYGEFKIGKNSHDKVWDEKYYKIYKKPYDYFPRGRVVYKYKENKFVLYADKCIDDNGIKEIINTFKLEINNTEIDRSDDHYVCKVCNKYYCE